MVEINFCKESGCSVACCRNIHGHVAGSAEHFLKAFPQAQKLGSEQELTDKIKNQEHGVYFFEERGWTYFAVSGVCPNLNSSLECLIHDRPYYPRFCTNMRVKSHQCNESQYVYNLNVLVLDDLK